MSTNNGILSCIYTNNLLLFGLLNPIYNIFFLLFSSSVISHHLLCNHTLLLKFSNIERVVTIVLCSVEPMMDVEHPKHVFLKTKTCCRLS